MKVPAKAKEDDTPHVPVSTALLALAPDVRTVLLLDAPTTAAHFLHRAGRSGRAGERGKVVVFGKAKGRGSEKARVVRKKVGALAA